MKKLAMVCCLLFPLTVFGFQASINVPNTTGTNAGAVVRANMNNALQAITTQQSGSIAPTTIYPYMSWVDTSATPAVLKVRNGANNAWLVVGNLVDGSGVKFLATEGATTTGGYSFYQDYGQDTGMFSIGDGQVDFYNNGVHTLAFTSNTFTWKGAAIPVADNNLQSSLNADLLDGQHASAFATSVQGTKADAAQPAATAINTSNIASQTVAIAATANRLENKHWVEISGSGSIPNNLYATYFLRMGGGHNYYMPSAWSSSGAVTFSSSAGSAAEGPIRCWITHAPSSASNDYLTCINYSGVTATLNYSVLSWE